MELDHDSLDSGLPPLPTDYSSVHLATVPSSDFFPGIVSLAGFTFGPTFNAFSSVDTPGTRDHKDAQAQPAVDQLTFVLSTTSAKLLTTQIDSENRDIVRLVSDRATLTLIDPVSQRPLHQGVAAHISVRARDQDIGRTVPVLAITDDMQGHATDDLRLRESPHTPARRVTVQEGEERKKTVRFVYESEVSDDGEDGIASFDSDVEMGECMSDEESDDELEEEERARQSYVADPRHPSAPSPDSAARRRDLPFSQYTTGTPLPYGLSSTTHASANTPQVFAVHTVSTTTPLTQSTLRQHLDAPGINPTRSTVPSYVEPTTVHPNDDLESLISYTDSEATDVQLPTPPPTPASALSVAAAPTLGAGNTANPATGSLPPLKPSLFGPNASVTSRSAFSNFKTVANPFVGSATFTVAARPTGLPNPNPGPAPSQQVALRRTVPLVPYSVSSSPTASISEHTMPAPQAGPGNVTRATGDESARGRTTATEAATPARVQEPQHTIQEHHAPPTAPIAIRHDLPAVGLHPNIFHRHLQLRRLFAAQVQGILQYCELLDIGKWLEFNHLKLREDVSVAGRRRFDWLYLAGSEWFGNPVLYAVEKLFLRQAGYFLDHGAGGFASWDHGSIRATVRTLANFRIEGPMAASITYRRIFGLYGLPLDIYGPGNRNVRYAEQDTHPENLTDNERVDRD